MVSGVHVPLSILQCYDRQVDDQNSVVFSVADDPAARINSDGVVGLTRALLAAGAKCVLFCLWPVPTEASKMCMKHFYTALLQGYSASKALSDTMKKIQAVKQFSHPSNWAGWVLVGSDVKLSSKVRFWAICRSFYHMHLLRVVSMFLCGLHTYKSGLVWVFVSFKICLC